MFLFAIICGFFSNCNKGKNGLENERPVSYRVVIYNILLLLCLVSVRKKMIESEGGKQLAYRSKGE